MWTDKQKVASNEVVGSYKILFFSLGGGCGFVVTYVIIMLCVGVFVMPCLKTYLTNTEALTDFVLHVFIHIIDIYLQAKPKWGLDLKGIVLEL